ncbi:hypothetical protein FYK55_18550 [Roseiconus nitratireducens]|uniref:Uncharacterized protein n=1 Tax=Roseiconus nitratireducens TaxID=2605748 RepID=A0A5M6D0B2_9BACT|nr:hypothetical protein [Roseiconus nitratireducens]KAA5540917.1 hypothetical protein FYK55_18550 [Roseiconus nitratireducens]
MKFLEEKEDLWACADGRWQPARAGSKAHTHLPAAPQCTGWILVRLETPPRHDVEGSRLLASQVTALFGLPIE